jgi:hypothetical protein
MSGGTGPLPQGDPRLLDTGAARELLTSTALARLAYLAPDGTPRVLPTWFHWTGVELVMPTFVSAPHVHRPAARLPALRARPRVAVVIESAGDPPVVLSVRGDAAVVERPGVLAEFALAAARYMGQDAAGAYLATLDDPSTVMARVAVVPAWVGLLDFRTRLPRALGGVRDGGGE